MIWRVVKHDLKYCCCVLFATVAAKSNFSNTNQRAMCIYCRKWTLLCIAFRAIRNCHN